MRFDIITIFPNIFDSYLSESILGRAQKQGLVEIKTHNLRDHTDDKHHTVDDSPYGGGVGMVMMVEPIYKALKAIQNTPPSSSPSPFEGEGRGGGLDNAPPSNSPLREGGEFLGEGGRSRVILLTPRGKKFTQKKAQELAKYSQLVLIAGRYEGVDERVTEFIDEEISIGDYVLNGGELPAAVIVEAVSRLLPGVLGKDESSQEESWSDENSAEYPHYTRPEVFTDASGKELKVPEILLSGHHAEIAAWRKKHRKYGILET